tara:strand:- start:483 stop:1514 length:1032 start_codon:yes stop_codon:yes gene_type:complete
LHKQFLEKGEILNFSLSRIKEKAIELDLYSIDHIFITGLARSGTTALLQALDSSNKFGALRYKYMPFILIPEIAKIYSKYFANKNNKKIERIHSDGIKINTNSPECLDEPYWLNTVYKKYSFEKSLLPHDIEKDNLKEYTFLLNQYKNIENKNRLVIKNNNSHLRILDLSYFLPNCKFIVVFRSPIPHALSLLNLHKRLTKLQTENKFLLPFMNMIGHWEFGNGKKPFIYKNEQSIILNTLDDMQIKYWLKQWIFTYEWLLQKICLKKRSNVKFVCYEDLCLNKKYLKNFYQAINLESDIINFEFELGKSNKFDVIKNLDKEDLDYADHLYKQLKKISKDNLR